jgi:tetratricopeptide (TPR) repeat protein
MAENNFEASPQVDVILNEVQKLISEKEFQIAYDKLLPALNLNSEYPPTLKLLADVSFELGNYFKAESYLQDAIKGDPEYTIEEIRKHYQLSQKENSLRINLNKRKLRIILAMFAIALFDIIWVLIWLQNTK